MQELLRFPIILKQIPFFRMKLNFHPNSKNSNQKQKLIIPESPSKRVPQFNTARFSTLGTFIIPPSGAAWDAQGNAGLCIVFRADFHEAVNPVRFAFFPTLCFALEHAHDLKIWLDTMKPDVFVASWAVQYTVTAA
jgi:hypothetical protein